LSNALLAAAAEGSITPFEERLILVRALTHFSMKKRSIWVHVLWHSIEHIDAVLLLEYVS
jgi:hypothetical protein